MRFIALGRPEFAQVAVAHLVTLAALALLGLVLAYWTWIWFGPREKPRMQPVVESVAREASAQGLFGGSPRKGNTVAPAGSAIKLLGVAAATAGRPGYAVVQLDARGSVAVREGENVAPGIRLAEVHPDHVVLDRGGARETLAWPKKSR